MHYIKMKLNQMKGSHMLDSEFNRRILSLAPPFQASDYAPSSLESLKEQSLGSLVVWSGASEGTIYGDAKVNHAFRAWHDSLHLKLNATFTPSRSGDGGHTSTTFVRTSGRIYVPPLKLLKYDQGAPPAKTYLWEN